MSNECRELRANRMMAHLLGALEMGQDVGPYGRRIFACVAQHFLPEGDLVMLLSRNVGEAKARELLSEVLSSGDPPPRRGKIIEYMKRQSFPILPDDHDAHLDDVYQGLNFPPQVAARIPRFAVGQGHEGRD